MTRPLAIASMHYRTLGRSSSAVASDTGKHTIERSRHAGEIQRVDEQARVLALPAGAGAHEAPKLLLIGLFLLRTLLLECAERSKLTLGVDDLGMLGRLRLESIDLYGDQILAKHVEKLLGGRQ